MPTFTKLFNHKCIGEGAFRKAMLLTNPKLVEKIALIPEKRWSNLTEIKIWNLVKGTEFEEYFVPVLAFDSSGEWLIMPKVETFDDDAWGSESKEYLRKEKILSSLGITDLKGRNRTKDGRALDYGLTESYEYDSERNYLFVKNRMKEIRENG